MIKINLLHTGFAGIPTPLYYINVIPIIICIALVIFYIRGTKNNRNPRYRPSNWQRVSFFASVVVLLIALEPPIDLYADDSFTIHQIQHALLRMVFPPLLLLGTPLTPLLRGIPAWGRQKIIKPLLSSKTIQVYYSFITNPVVTAVIYIITLYFWQVSFVHNASVENILIHQVMHITMIVSSLLFWWMMIDSKPHTSKLHYGIRILFLGLLIFPNTFLGSIITFSSTAFYTAYNPADSPFTMSLLRDQHIGGLILWMSGDMMNVIVAAVTMGVWYNKEEGNSQYT